MFTFKRIFVLLFILVTFACEVSATNIKASPPVIRSISISKYILDYREELLLECDAYDPDGGMIKEYIWEIRDMDGELIFEFLTMGKECLFMPVAKGYFKVFVTVVDDEGDSTRGFLESPYSTDWSYVIDSGLNYEGAMLPFIKNDSGFNMKKLNTYIVNASDEPVELTISFFDYNRQEVYHVDQILNGKENYMLLSDDYPSNSEIKYGIFSAKGHVAVANEIITDTGKMVNKFSTIEQKKIFIPHIPVSVDFWESYFFLVDNRFDMYYHEYKYAVYIDNVQNFFYKNDENFIVLNLEDFVNSNTLEQKSWGWIDCGELNPFGDTVCDKNFSGFEIFAHNNTDGASVYCGGSASLSLFIPHIPKETNIFWTGFAVVNTEKKDSVATFYFYSENGEFLGSQNLSIPAQSKIVGTMKELFPDYFGRADWGYIISDTHLIGIEIYGTLKNGICGFNLPDIASLEGYFPVLMSGEDLWNGFALVNPGEEAAQVKITLIKNASGTKYSVGVNLNAKNKISKVVEDFFSNIEIEQGDYIFFESDKPLIGIMVNGDLERTFMSAISAIK